MKTQPQHLLNLLDETAKSTDRAWAINLITHDQLYEYEPTIRSLLDHPDGIIRGEALRRLFFMWQREDLLDRACHMALNDEDESARQDGIDALGMHYKNGIKDEEKKKKVMSTLIRCLLQEPDRSGQISAYSAILSILDGNDKFAPVTWNRENDVD